MKATTINPLNPGKENHFRNHMKILSIKAARSTHLHCITQC